MQTSMSSLGNTTLACRTVRLASGAVIAPPDKPTGAKDRGGYSAKYRISPNDGARGTLISLCPFLAFLGKNQFELSHLLHEMERSTPWNGVGNDFYRDSLRPVLNKYGQEMNNQLVSDYLRAKELFEIIRNRVLGDDSSSVQDRVAIIRRLELLTGKEFRSTSEFHREVQAFIDNEGERLKSLGKRIHKARKAKGWTLKRLAAELGYRSHSAFILYEKDKRLPPKEVIEWLLAEEKNSSQDALHAQNVSTPSIYTQE